MSRHFHRVFILNDIQRVRDLLRPMPESDRLHVIAEALCDLNDVKPEAERTHRASCGCYDWDISIDYRPHHERYPEVKE